jgi:acyl-CoA synthetase (AMP-forming)/AMP-acid ligase II
MGIIARIWAQPPERIAVKTGAADVSYARLTADVDAAVAALRKDGLGPGSIIGIRAGYAENGHSYANWVAHLAAIKLGASHISMTDKSSIKAGLQASKVVRVVGNFESLIDVPLSVKRLQVHFEPTGPAPVTEAQPNEESSARRLNLTSGTTGRPKFIAWDAGMIEGRVDQVAEGGTVNDETVLLPLLHLRTTAGFRYPLAVWAAGGCVQLPAARKGLERDREALPDNNAIVCSPPQLKERLAGIEGDWPGKNKRLIVLLGGRLPAAMRDAALERACARLMISYGSTETGSIATGDHDVISRHPGAVGFVRPGVEVEIGAPGGGTVPPGQPGLIRTRSPIMAADYEQGSAPSAGAGAGGHFRDGWFYPGDIGRLYEDGLLAIDGRTGDTLNVGGWKVAAIDLETKVAEMSGVKDVCAVAMQLPEGDILTFGIVCDDGIDLNAVREGIRAMLSQTRRFHVIRLPVIPRNAMGKIPRALIASQLAALYGAKKKSAANA